MSSFVLDDLQPSFVSYEALEVACHAIENYCDRLTELELEKLKVCLLVNYLIHSTVSLHVLNPCAGSLLSSYFRDIANEVRTSASTCWIT